MREMGSLFLLLDQVLDSAAATSGVWDRSPVQFRESRLLLIDFRGLG
jgi:hypothetical protein